MFGSNLSPAEKQMRRMEKDRQREERRVAQIAADAEAAERRKERFEAMPHFVVRETREVTVKAANMQDAIELAGVAFKYGQDEDYELPYHQRPWRTEGDTVDKVRSVSIKASELDFG